MIGNQAAVILLERIVRERRVHAVLLLGPDSIGKRTAVFEVVARVFGRLPATLLHDLCLTPSVPGKGPSIADARMVMQHLSRRPVEIPQTLVIIQDADRMSAEAASALLVTLEQPPEHAFVVLTAEQPSAILPTIRSRCAAITFGLVSDQELVSALTQEFKLDPTQRADILSLARGRPGVAIRALAEDQRAASSELIRQLTTWLEGDLTDRLALVRRLSDDPLSANRFMLELAYRVPPQHKAAALTAVRRLTHHVQPRVVLEAFAMLTS